MSTPPLEARSWMVGEVVPLDLSVLEQARSFSAATLHEAAGQTGALPSAIRPMVPGREVCGPAVTVECAPFDNLWLHRALYVESAPSAILVVSVADAYEAGYWGEILSHAAQARGLGGLVIDGCVRDGGPLAEIGFPVFARGLCIRGTGKHPTHGGINVPLVIGDVEIRPNDLVVGDGDGVMVIPLARVTQVLETAQVRVEQEATIIERLRTGERTLDIYGFHERSHTA